MCLFHPLGNVQYAFSAVLPQLALWTVRQRILFFLFIYFYQCLPLLSVNYSFHLLENLLSSSLTSRTTCSCKMSFYLSLSSWAIFFSFSTFAFLMIFLRSQLHLVIFPFPSLSDITYLIYLPQSFRTCLFRLIGLFNYCSICCWMDSTHALVEMLIYIWKILNLLICCLFPFLSFSLAQSFSFKIFNARSEFILCH